MLAGARQSGTNFAQLYERFYVVRRKVATCIAIAMVLGLGYHVIFGENGLTAYEQKRRNSATLDKELKTLQHENDLLKGHVQSLQSDPSAIEHQAREELHYTRPGEVIYTLPAAPPASDSNASASPQKN